MSENTFDTEEVNLQIQPLPGYIDADGAFKLNTPLLSSFNFDGSIPKFDGQINAGDVEPGYLIQIESGGQYFPVVSIEKEEADLEDSPSGIISIGYIDSQGATVSVEYEETDQVSVVYEDWANKVLGSQGWGITAGGNAIFTNIAARGRIEAEEGYISGTLTIGSGGATTINDLATTADLNGYIPDGSAAADIISNSTTITGGNIFTGTIQSQFYSYTSGLYSNNGMQIGLDGNGYIRSPNFYLDTSGNAYFKGDITAKSGYFGNSNYGMSIVDDGSTVTIRSTTLRMGSQNVFGILHGSIDFYTTGGSSIGQISSAASNKTWSGLGDGIILGTTSDYFFLPRSTNSTKSRYLGSGFEWYGQSGVRIMTISGGSGGLRIENNTGGIQVSGGGDISVSGGGRFVGDGSGLTNLPGGGGGGVTSFKFGDNGLTETGAVAITGAEIITAINAGSIGNGKLANSTIQIMSTTKSLGQSFTQGEIDGDVITANTLPPAKISNANNLFSIGGTGIPRGTAISTISGPLTIGDLTVSTSLDYVFNLGTTNINLNRSQQALGATLGGVNISGSAGQLSNTTSLIGTTWGGQGGIIYNNNGVLAGTAAGTTGQFLRSNGAAAPTWQTVNIMTNPMTTTGDLIFASNTGTPSTPGRIPLGAQGAILKVVNTLGLLVPSWLPRGTAGQVLKVNSTGTDIEWGTDATGSGLTNPMTGAGQMIYGSTATNPSTPAAVAAGTSGQFLRSGGTGAPTWTSSLFTLGTTAITAGGTTTSLSGITFSGITLNQEVTLGITSAATNGNVLVKGGTGNMRLGGTNIGSTIRIKENINSIDDDERIYSLRPVSFYLKKEHQLATAIETASVQIGFIAEEVLQIIPEAIQYAPESNEIWNYSERPILALAVKAIQDQKNKIDLLENTIAVLEARLDAAGL